MRRSIFLPGSAANSALALVGVAAGHCILGLLLYRWQSLRPTVAFPVWLLLGAPLAVGFAGYWLVLWWSPWLRFAAMPTRIAPLVVRHILLLLLAGVAIFFSSWIYLIIIISMYGG